MKPIHSSRAITKMCAGPKFAGNIAERHDIAAVRPDVAEFDTHAFIEPRHGVAIPGQSNKHLARPKVGRHAAGSISRLMMSSSIPAPVTS
jgi:hypothetical protein